MSVRRPARHSDVLSPDVKSQAIPRSDCKVCTRPRRRDTCALRVGGCDNLPQKHATVVHVLRDSCTLTQDTFPGLDDYLNSEKCFYRLKTIVAQDLCTRSAAMFSGIHAHPMRVFVSNHVYLPPHEGPPVPASVAVVAAEARNSGCFLPARGPCTASDMADLKKRSVP